MHDVIDMFCIETMSQPWLNNTHIITPLKIHPREKVQGQAKQMKTCPYTHLHYVHNGGNRQIQNLVGKNSMAMIIVLV